MPCRCCSATKAPKGLQYDNVGDKNINRYLRMAAGRIKRKYSDPFYDEVDWKKEWVIAFEHHLYGCPELGL